MTVDPKSVGLAYLATPFTDYPKGHWAAYADASKIGGRLILSGIKVYSPIAHTWGLAKFSGIDPCDHSIWLPFDEAMMTVCDTLIVAHMESWDKSYGISCEVEFFEKASKPIYDLDPESMMMVRRQRQKPPRQRYEGLTDSQIREETESYLDPNSVEKLIADAIQRIDEIDHAPMDRAYFSLQDERQTLARFIAKHMAPFAHEKASKP